MRCNSKGREVCAGARIPRGYAPRMLCAHTRHPRSAQRFGLQQQGFQSTLSLSAPIGLLGGVDKHRGFGCLALALPPGTLRGRTGDLCAKAVEGLALALEGIDHIQGSHGLAACVLSVGHGVADDVLQEDLEHAAGLLVDQAADALHAAAPSKAADGGLLQGSEVGEGRGESGVRPLGERGGSSWRARWGTGLRGSSQPTHSDALDVVAQHLAVALGAALAQTLATLATARHC